MKKQMKIIPLSDIEKLSIEQLEYLISKGYQLVNTKEKHNFDNTKISKLYPLYLDK